MSTDETGAQGEGAVVTSNSGSPAIELEIQKLVDEKKQTDARERALSGDSDLEGSSDEGDGEEQQYDRMSRAESLSAKVKKFSSWECITWHLFLIVFWVMVTLGRTNADLNFTQSAATKHKFLESVTYNPEYGAGEKTFDDMSSFIDFYNYLEVFMQIAMKENTDSGEYIEDENKRYYPLGRSRLLGGVRVRQTRFKDKNCDLRKNKFPICYDLATDYEKKLDVNLTEFNETAWEEIHLEHQSAGDLDDAVWRGKFGTYSGGGYVVDFPLDRNRSLDIVSELRNIDWLDDSTELVVIDFALYNPTSHLHTIARIALEIKSGGTFGNYEIKTWLFDRFKTDDAGLYITCCVLVLLFILWFTFLMGREMYQDGCSCTKNVGYWGKTKWRYVDFINLLVFYTWIIVFAVNISLFSTDKLYSIDKYESLRYLQYLYLAEVSLLAGNGFISFVKIFKYFSANERLRFFFTMMGRAATDIALFVLVLCVWFIAFGVFGFLTFSSDIDDFRSPFFAFFNMMRFVVSDLPYENLANSSRSVGSVYYVVWSLLMALILANVFIALLSEAYAEVREDLKANEGKAGIFGGLFQRRLNMIGDYVRSFGLTQNVDDLDEDGDGQISIKELMNETGWPEDKATEFMMKFDKDKNGQLSAEEWQWMQGQVDKFEKEWNNKILREQRQKKKKAEKEEEQLLEQMRTPALGGFDSSYSIANSAAFELAASQAISGAANPGPPIGLAQKAEFERLKDKLSLLEDMMKVMITNQPEGELTLAKLERKQRARNKRRIQMLKKASSLRSNPMESTMKDDSSPEKAGGRTGSTVMGVLSSSESAPVSGAASPDGNE